MENNTENTGQTVDNLLQDTSFLESVEFKDVPLSTQRVPIPDFSGDQPKTTEIPVDNNQQETTTTNTDNPTNQPTEQTQEANPIEIDHEEFSSLLSDATDGKITSLDQVYQIIEENNRLKQIAENPATAFKTPEQKQLFEFLNSYQSNDYESGIQSFARLKSLDIDNLKPEDAIKERFIMEHSKFNIARDEAEKLFQIEFDEKYQKYGELAASAIKKEGYEAKIALSEMKNKFTTPVVDEQKVKNEEQVRQQQELYLDTVENSLKGFNALVIGIDDENEFAYEIEDTESIREAMVNPQEFLNSRWLGSDGQLNAEQMKQDFAVLNNLDRIIEQVTVHAMNIAKEQSIRERNNIPDRNSPPASNAGQGNGGIPQSMEEAILKGTVRNLK
jgi:hypothetical protein